VRRCYKVLRNNPLFIAKIDFPECNRFRAFGGMLRLVYATKMFENEGSYQNPLEIV
jgi:hypothetical protein